MTIDVGRFSEAPNTSAEEPADKAGEEQKPPELVYGSPAGRGSGLRGG